MTIVFFCILITLIIISINIGISFEINKKDDIKTIFYIKILKKIKIYSKPIKFEKMKVKIDEEKLKKIDYVQFIKEIIKKMIIKKLKIVIELENENMILNTYITAIIATLIESLRLIKKVDDIYYKITTSEKNKINLDIKLEIYMLQIVKSILKCINLQKKESIYNN